ncbi:hypothetical protein LEN26_021420, partial [Aphanomyces euteiches]
MSPTLDRARESSHDEYPKQTIADLASQRARQILSISKRISFATFQRKFQRIPNIWGSAESNSKESSEETLFPSITSSSSPRSMGSEQDAQFEDELLFEVEDQIRMQRDQAKAIVSLARRAELELKEAEDMPNTDYRQVKNIDGQLTVKRKPTSREEVLLAIAPQRRLALTRARANSAPTELTLMANQVPDEIAPTEKRIISNLYQAVSTQAKVNARVQADVGTIGTQLAETATAIQTQIASTAFTQQQLEERLAIEFDIHKHHLEGMVARSDAIENELVTQRSNTEAQIARLSDQLKTSEAKMSVDLDRLTINIDATLKKNQTLTRESISATSDNLYLEQKKQGDKIDEFMGRQEQQNQNLLALIQQTAETQRQIVQQSKQREIEIDNRLSNKDTHLELARTSGQNSQNQIDKLFQLVEKIRLDLTAAVGDGQHLSQQTQLSFEKRFAESRAQAQMELQQRMNDSAAQVQLAYEKAMKEASDAAMARQEAWQREMQVTQASDMTKINELLQTKLLEIMRVAMQVTPSKDTPAKRTAGSTTTTTTKMSTKTKSQPPST